MARASKLPGVSPRARPSAAAARPITTLFLDIGGVLLTDGWDRHARKRAATTFTLELAELEQRHHLTESRP